MTSAGSRVGGSEKDLGVEGATDEQTDVFSGAPGPLAQLALSGSRAS
jgi:hypothetical protein